MKIAICDDEAIMHTELKKHLNQYSKDRNLDISYFDFLNGNELVANTIEYDLIFMDYQMGDFDGIETAKALRKKNNQTTIIFLTSYSQVVFDTFEVNTFRFLTKPIEEKKLFSSLDDFLKSKTEDNFLIVKIDEVTMKINHDSIIYIEADDKYSIIRTCDKFYNCNMTLADVEKKLPADKFFRSHRTYLVNLKHVSSHTKTDIIFDNNEKSKISRAKSIQFKEAFINYIKRYRISQW